MNFLGADMRVAAVLAASLTLAAAASVTACQSKSTAAAGAAPSSASATGASAAAADATSAAAAGNSGSSGGVKSFDVCKALTAAGASQITGITFTKTKSDSTGGQVFSCEYDGPNYALLQVTVSTQDGKDLFSVDVSALKSVGHTPDSVSGVGDEAFSEPDPKGNAGSVGASAYGSYGAVFGDTYIKIGGLTYVTASQGKQIVGELHGKL
jgi:hypothetical protein